MVIVLEGQSKTSKICNPSDPGGYFMYHLNELQKFYALLTDRIFVLCMDLRTSSSYLSMQH